MASSIKSESHGVGRFVERQLRNWELAQQQGNAAPREAGQQVEHFIAISRAVGLPGREIASILALRLGWPTFDREILQAMAGDEAHRRELYEALDERDTNWLEEFLRGISSQKESREEYFHRLCATVLALARKSRAIFVGRAADLILPKDSGMRVRITASRDYCIQTYARERGLPFEKAVRDVEEMEHERARFIRHHFHIEASEQTRHDVIINMERFTANQAADIIMTALRVRGIVT